MRQLTLGLQALQAGLQLRHLAPQRIPLLGQLVCLAQLHKK